MELTNCARYLDRRFDDPGADGRVERVTIDARNPPSPSLQMAYVHRPNLLQFQGEDAVGLYPLLPLPLNTLNTRITPR